MTTTRCTQLLLPLLFPLLALPAAAQQPTPPPQVGVAARATAHAERRAEKRKEVADRLARPVRVQGPLPLPVALANANALIASGKPAGGSCDGKDTCTLRLSPPPGQILVVTAVWSATVVRCDDLTTSTPANGAPISVAWRCEHELTVQGLGAGYAGFTIAK